MEREVALYKSYGFSGGVHPPENKELTEKKVIVQCPPPPQVIIPVQQHIGAPSKPIVEKGTVVRIGDLVSESSGFVSVPAHASISGTVATVENRPHPFGMPVLSVVIENDGQEKWNPDITFDEKYLDLDRREMLDRIRNAGLAGMGGAAFPTHVKLNPPADKKIDTVLLNGAECEPYLTSDHQLMLQEPQKIIQGLQLIQKILGAKNVAIGVEDNKTDAVKVLKKAIAGLKFACQVVVLHVKYPQGAEKQLIKAVTGRSVPSGGLPMDVGCVVQNVGTAAAVYDAVAFKKPLIERVVTVTGAGIREPRNVLTRIGTPYSFLFEFCGGMTEDVGKIIMGGPMMGLAQSSLDAMVIKGTSGIVLFTQKQSRRLQERTCISCARCVDVCPMKLLPKMLGLLVRNNRIDESKQYHVMDCIECGCCSYVCPAHINLVHLIKHGKSQLIKKTKKAS